MNDIRRLEYGAGSPMAHTWRTQRRCGSAMTHSSTFKVGQSGMELCTPRWRKLVTVMWWGGERCTIWSKCQNTRVIGCSFFFGCFRCQWLLQLRKQTGCISAPHETDAGLLLALPLVAEVSRCDFSLWWTAHAGSWQERGSSRKQDKNYQYHVWEGWQSKIGPDKFWWADLSACVSSCSHKIDRLIKTNDVTQFLLWSWGQCFALPLQCTAMRSSAQQCIGNETT